MRKIRELMAVWEGWQRFNQPADFQPPPWTEAEVFNNELPWTAASASQGLTEQHLRYKVRGGWKGALANRCCRIKLTRWHSTSTLTLQNMHTFSVTHLQ